MDETASLASSPLSGGSDSGRISRRLLDAKSEQKPMIGLHTPGKV